jgi:hypothetical protein
LHLWCSVYAQLSTHSNGQQKIRYLMRIKQENLSLKQARPYLPAYYYSRVPPSTAHSLATLLVSAVGQGFAMYA